MRFAEPFKLSPDLDPKQKLEKERMMFLELTQSKSIDDSSVALPNLSRSLPVGEFDGSVTPHQHDGGANQVAAVNRWRPSFSH